MKKLSWIGAGFLAPLIIFALVAIATEVTNCDHVTTPVSTSLKLEATTYIKKSGQLLLESCYCAKEKSATSQIRMQSQSSME